MINESQSEDAFLGDVTRTHLVTAIAVFMLSVFIIALYLTSKAEWQEKLNIAEQHNTTAANSKTTLITSKTTTNENTMAVDKALEEAVTEAQTATGSSEDLADEITYLKRELSQYRLADSLRTQAIMNTGSYKVYGFFKNEKYKTEKQVADKFHVKSEKAVKIAEVNNEKAFVVPVRGTHIAKTGDTAFYLAKKYYKNEKLAYLIEEFNGEIKAGMVVFIPFEK